MKRILFIATLWLTALTGFAQAPVFPTLIPNPQLFREPATKNLWLRTGNEWRNLIDSIQLVNYIATHGTAGGVSTFNSRNGNVVFSLADINATGSRLSTTYLRGDNTWATVSASTAWGSITGSITSQSDLNTALNNKQNTLSITTTGTSGAATLVGSTLNIPQYSGGGGGVSSFNTRTGAITLALTDIPATGTPSSTTYLRGDGTWSPGAGGGGVWGGITGTLSSQADLQTALNTKQNTLSVVSTGLNYGPASISGSTLTIPNYITYGTTPSIVTTNLITDFNFGNAASVTTSAGKVTQIVDGIGSVVSSQATGASQPTYTVSGGPGGNGYATFAGAQTLAGNLLTSSTNFTLFVTRRTNNSGVIDAELGVFQNGNTGTNGYGMVDFQVGLEGLFFTSVTSNNQPSFNHFPNIWETFAVSVNTGSATYYAPSGFKYLRITSIPNTPTGGHVIGSVSSSGLNPYKGDISRILLYNTSLSDAQIAQNLQYLNANLPLPSIVAAGGDSRFAGYFINVYVPDIVNTNLNQAGKYCNVLNTAVIGRTTDDIINNFATEVAANYKKGVTNVYFVMAGHNDIVAGGKTATYIYNNIVTICGLARAAGYKVIVCTDMYNSAAVGSAYNTIKDTYNASIRTNYALFADGLADVNAVSQASITNMANTTYSFDGTHPTNLLAGFMATPISTAIQTVLTANPASSSSLGGVVYSDLTGIQVTKANTSTTQMFLSETGTGSAGAVPVWAPITQVNGNTVLAGTGTLGLSNAVTYNIKAESSATLVAGVATFAVTGATSSSHCYAQLLTQGGTTTTTAEYKTSCTTNSCTITAATNAGATNTTDTSILAYTVVN